MNTTKKTTTVEIALEAFRAAVTAEKLASEQLAKVTKHPTSIYAIREAEIRELEAHDDRKVAEGIAGPLLTAQDAAGGDRLAMLADLPTLERELAAAIACQGDAATVSAAAAAFWRRLRASDLARLDIATRRIAAGLPQPAAAPPVAGVEGQLDKYRERLLARITETPRRPNEARARLLAAVVDRERAKDEKALREEEKRAAEELRNREALKAYQERQDEGVAAALAAEKAAAIESQRVELAELAAASRAREVAGAPMRTRLAPPPADENDEFESADS